MVGFIGFLLVAWVVLTVIGFVFKSLLWLAFIGLVLIVVTLIYGGVKLRSKA